MSKVAVLVADGFEEIEAVSIIDVMRRGGIEVVACSLNSSLEAKGANGITILCDALLDSVGIDELDMVVLPGGWGGTKALAEDDRVQNLLKAMDAKNKLIGAICAAPFALDRAGVLKGSYTCYPSVEEEIKSGKYLGGASAVVESENIMTSRGPATAICFGLAIVKKLVGLEVYESLRGGLLAEECCVE